jgi:hypothetical protein
MPYTTTGGVKKVARYRYNFEMRRTPDSDSDFTNVFSLVDAANSSGTPNYVANMENMANMENWMRVFAANHAAGNWDSFGAQNAQNLYGYIGTLGTKYTLLMWDFNIVFGNSGSWGPGQNLFTVNGKTPTCRIFTTIPPSCACIGAPCRNWSTDRSTSPTADRCSWPNTTPSPTTASASKIPREHRTVAFPGAEQHRLATGRGQRHQLLRQSQPSPSATTSPIFPGARRSMWTTVWINGVAYPLTWTSLTNWTVTVPLTNGTNYLSIVGVDHTGQPIAGDSNQLTVNYSGTIPSPVGHVAINEIMWNPAVTNAQYVELFNNSTNVTFTICPAGSCKACPTPSRPAPCCRRWVSWCWRPTPRPLPRLTERPTLCLTLSTPRFRPANCFPWSNPAAAAT